MLGLISILEIIFQKLYKLSKGLRVPIDSKLCLGKVSKDQGHPAAFAPHK